VLPFGDEELIPFGQIIRDRVIPPGRNGRKLHLSTLIRWATDGSRGPSGEKVRLEAARLGGRWLTSVEAISRFMRALTPPAPPAPSSQTPCTPGQRQRAAERAGRELDNLGI
jgi:hypothetical protein